MKSAWVRRQFEIEIRDVPAPPLKSGEVLVRIEACGICGTDLHFARILAESWMPLGHEAVGIVEEVSDPRDQDLLGRRVLALNYTACNKCEPCRNGNWMHCINMPTYMEEEKGWQAGVAEYLVLGRDLVHPYEDIDPISATLAEPMSVALDLVETVGIPFESDVVVFGPGPIGLLAARIAKLKGARRVLMVVPGLESERHKKRAEVARKLGVAEIVDASCGDVALQVKSLCPDGVDRVLITAPPRTLVDAIEIAKFGAFIGLIGIEYGKGAFVEFNVNEFHFKKLQLRASHAIPDVRFPQILSSFKDLNVDPSIFVTHVFKLDDVAEAMRIADSRDEPVVKVVVDCT
jgi:L-iditol 2-dehydrogenase